MADTLAALHDVDPDAVGLGDLGRHEGYIERQLKRWRGQYDQMQVEGVDHGGLVERVSDELARRIPKQQRTSVVHGDYRMDNVVLADDGTVRAILDWEICTLGDPLADLGLLMDYWSDPDDAMAVLGLSPTTAPGFSTKAQILERYGSVSDLDVSGVGYYVAFGYWKLALHSPGRLRPLRGRRRRGRPGQRRGLPDPDRAALRDGGRVAGDRPVSPEGNGLTEIFEVHQEPVLREPILVVALEGWVDAGLGATTAIATLLGQGHTEPDRHVQRRALPRPAGPAAGGPHRQRHHDRADLAPHRRAPGNGRIGAGHALPGRARARLPLARLHRRRGGAGPLLARAHGGGPRRLPGAGAPHPPGEAGRHRAVGLGRPH